METVSLNVKKTVANNKDDGRLKRKVFLSPIVEKNVMDRKQWLSSLFLSIYDIPGNLNIKFELVGYNFFYTIEPGYRLQHYV